MSEKNIEHKRKGTAKGGRNKIDRDDVKKNFNIRMSKNDLDKLKAKYNNKSGIKETFTEYLRAILLNKDVHVVYYERGKLELIREFSAIGNNVNQIAKHINQKGISENLIYHFDKISKELYRANEMMYGKAD